VLNGFTYDNITPQSPIKVGGCPTGIGIDPATDTAYVANAATGAVTLINTKTLTASNKTIPVGSDPTDVTVFLNPVSSLPSYVYVTNSGSNTVSVINTATNTVVATIIVP
jgi:YVTN family beta-propeller protein